MEILLEQLNLHEAFCFCKNCRLKVRMFDLEINSGRGGYNSVPTNSYKPDGKLYDLVLLLCVWPP
jgi:hypothetical protein